VSAPILRGIRAVAAAAAVAAVHVACALPAFENVEGDASTSASTGGSAVGGGGGGSAGGMAGGAGGSPMSPPLVEVPGAGYAIGATEVTHTHYAAFLDAAPPLVGQDAICAWNDDFTPVSWTGPSGKEDLPVYGVDWCDAYGFCKWAGQRLCGKVGGGPTPFDDTNVSYQDDQWARACSAAGMLSFPYGSEFDAQKCNGEEYGAGAAIEVGEAMGCEGGYPGIFDLAGNVGEWVDSCDGTRGQADLCTSRGGFYGASGEAVSCGGAATTTRDKRIAGLGFRCCADTGL